MNTCTCTCRTEMGAPLSEIMALFFFHFLAELLSADWCTPRSLQRSESTLARLCIIAKNMQKAKHLDLLGTLDFLLTQCSTCLRGAGTEDEE